MQKAMAKARPEFTARFNQVTAGESQPVTAHKIETSQAYVSTIKRGFVVPGAEIVRRIAAVYGGGEESWLTDAGFIEPDYSGVGRLIAGLAELGISPYDLHTEQDPTTLSVEQAEGIISSLKEALGRRAKRNEEGQPEG